MEDYWSLAVAWAKEHYPNSTVKHHYAFANAVEYLVTGGTPISRTGPSAREHLVSWLLSGPQGKVDTSQGITIVYPDGSLPQAGNWTWEEALTFCAPACLLPITNTEWCKLLVRIKKHEHCFDDPD